MNLKELSLMATEEKVVLTKGILGEHRCFCSRCEINSKVTPTKNETTTSAEVVCNKCSNKFWVNK